MSNIIVKKEHETGSGQMVYSYLLLHRMGQLGVRAS